jgi:F0F1-type ATP synthase membrane subunit b/b'
MHLFPDPVLVVVQLAPFLVLMVGLHLILFKPMLAFIEARHAATVGARAEAEKLQATAGEQVGRYEAAVASARAEIAELRTARRAAANSEYARVVGAAREAADGQVAEAVKRLRVEHASARDEMSVSARALANDAAAQVLGRPLTQQMEA